MFAACLVACSESLECSTCLGKHQEAYAPDKSASEDILSQGLSSGAVSTCVWKDTTIQRGIPVVGNNNLRIWGFYRGTCYLKASAGSDMQQGACRYPDTCEATVLKVQGVIYNVDRAVLVGPKNEPRFFCPIASRRHTETTGDDNILIY